MDFNLVLLAVLLTIYSFHMYKKNVLLESRVRMLEQSNESNSLQNKLLIEELSRIASSIDTNQDEFIDVIGFNVASALEHKAERENLEDEPDLGIGGNKIELDAPTLQFDSFPSDFDSQLL